MNFLKLNIGLALLATTLQMNSVAYAAGAMATEEALQTEIANRVAADEVLANRISNISLVPGPQGDTGAKGDKGERGPQGADNSDQIAALQASNILLQERLSQLEAIVDKVVTVTAYAVGDVGPAGGIVFYTSNGGVNGLEAAPVDQDDGRGAEWGCGGITVVGAAGTAIGTGASNTADILAASCVSSNPKKSLAVELVSSYSLNGFNDWFLPSKDELAALHAAKSVVGGLANSNYWSSTEYYAYAWNQYFYNGYQDFHVRDNTLKVRAIRAF